ncbi:MAG: response regulator [Eubacteriales bacterium]|nr:response regulator [Eubacteriales bacterium]
MNILVIDDSQLYLTIAEKYLKSIETVSEIILCNDPEKAQSIVDTQKIDIIIMDIVMPVLTGFELLKNFRSEHRYDDIPIIMFTSLNDAESFQKCYELGASDYINKPIDAIEFYARLKVAIQTKQNSDDLKTLLKMMQHQNEELTETNKNLADAKFHLVQAEKMAAIGQLSAGIAHEINNPMGFVSSNFEILQRYFERISAYLKAVDEFIWKKDLSDYSKLSAEIEVLREKHKSLKMEVIRNELSGVLADSETGVQRVTEIVSSLRLFARSVKDDEKDTYDLQTIVSQVLLISNNEIKYVARTEVDVPADLLLFCNQVQIGQVLINLLVNAAQAIKTQKRSELGLIKISAQKKDSKIVITVTDDGPGIPKENLLRIFDPFFTTKDIGQGTGLGLSISYDIIVNKHEGTIDVTSELGKGTTFVIELPSV